MTAKVDRTQEWLAFGRAVTGADPWTVAPVVQLIRSSRPRIFAISGPAGAGKSTVATAVKAALAGHGIRAVALSLDDFYLSRSERERRGLAWRAAPGSHDLDLMEETLAAIRDGAVPLSLPRFDFSRDDRAADDESLEEAPDVVLFDGWILGYDGEGYGRILPYLDWHLHLAVPPEVAKQRRFDRETRLREDTGRAFSPLEMQRFWDDVLGPGMDRWVPASAEHADVVVCLDGDSSSCLADPRLDDYLLRPAPNP